MGCCASQNKKRAHTYNKPNTTKIVPIDKDLSNANQNLSQREPNLIELAIKNGDIEELNDMFNKKEVTVSTQLGMNISILHYTVLKVNHPEVVEFIIKKGANVDEVEQETGNTPLFFAAVDLKESIVRVLLKYNPNINHKNNSGEDIFKFLERSLELKKNNIRGRESVKPLKDIKDSHAEFEVLDDDGNNNPNNNSLGSNKDFGYNKDNKNGYERNELTHEEFEAYQSILAILEEYKIKSSKVKV
jgi:hypothetical protein